MPELSTISSAYVRTLLEARQRGFATNAAGLSQLEAAFIDAILRLSDDIDATDNPVTAERAAALQRQLLGLLQGIEDKLNRTVGRSVTTTVKQILDLHQSVNASLAQQFLGTGAASIAGRFDLVPSRVVSVLAARRGNAATFRTLINRHLTEIAPELDTMLTSAIARGVSTRRLAKDVAGLLGGNYTDVGGYGLADADVVGLRTIQHDAKRIAVSETMNALREANTQALQASPIVKAARWQRSGRHSAICECDVLAESDLYGYGAGYYPPERWPVAPHPFCACTQGGPVIFRRPSEWSDPKPPPRSLEVYPAEMALKPAWEEAWTPKRAERMRETVARSLGLEVQRRRSREAA